MRREGKGGAFMSKFSLWAIPLGPLGGHRDHISLGTSGAVGAGKRGIVQSACPVPWAREMRS